MLAKLSFRNARRQAGDYLVYFITITLSAALIYAFNSLVFSKEVAALQGMMHNLTFFITLASIVVVAILGWLVYYTQRFMLAKRSRELGTYVLLGIENRQVARMFLAENTAVGLVALLLGTLAGNLVYQGLRAVLFHLFELPYAFSFAFSPGAAALTAGYFAAIFLFSMLLCRKRIRRMSIRDMMELDRKNEGEIVEKSKSRKKLFAASLVCGVAGTALLLLRSLLPGILGAALLIFFCYAFFISFSSGVPDYFDKRPAKKYRGSNLLVFRSLSMKLASMGITLGTIALIFTATLLAEGVALLFQNQFNQHEKLTTGFDLFISAPAGNGNFEKYDAYIEENMKVARQRNYTTYNANNDDVAQYLKANTEYWFGFEYDQLMRYSDYAALRAMLGYAPVELREGEYIIHCLGHLEPLMQNYGGGLALGGATLQPGPIYTETFTQFRWDGNGRGFILVAPDAAVAGQPPSMDIRAYVTAAPLAPEVAAGVQEIRDSVLDYSEDSYNIRNTIFARSLVKQENATLSAMIVFPLFYLALVLIMVAATILTIQFLSDAQKLGRHYATLNDLGMDRREMRRALNRHFALYYSMPVLPPVLICAVFMFSLGHAFDPGIVPSNAHLWGIIGFNLLLFFAIYLVYILAAGSSMKKSVLPQ